MLGGHTQTPAHVKGQVGKHRSIRAQEGFELVFGCIW
jgi:hypothetical protein